MYYSKKLCCRGYAALLAVLILSALLSAAVLEAGTEGFWSRFDTLDRENKEVAKASAHACANSALFKLAEDSVYQPKPGGEAVTIDDSHDCTIESVVLSEGIATIETSANNASVHMSSEMRARTVAGVWAVISERDVINSAPH